MRCIQTLFKFIVLIFLFCSLSLADTGTESTTDDGFSCADGETKHTGAYCDGQVCQICNVCGDDYVVEEAGEECDDNAGNDPLAQCNNDCKKTICGDELIQTPNGFDTVEQCDQGAANSNTGTCSADCQITKCGDGFTQAPNGEGETEECDAADQNNDHGECNTSCQITTCGDELLQQPNGEGVVEQCDKRDFAAGFTIESHICKTDCTAEVRNADFILKVYFRKIGTDTLIPATEAQPGTGFDYQEDFVIVYEVENLGNVALKDITASDDRGSTVSLVNNADGDDLLSPGEKWLFETETISPELPEQFEVNALVEAYDTDLDAKVVLSRTESGYFCKDKDGDQVFCTTCVNCGNDRAKFYYEVLPTPGVEIVAYIKVNDGDWQAAEGLTTLTASDTDDVYFRYDVINTGNVPLSDITVTHSYTNGGQTVTEILTLDQRTASGNGDAILDYQETWTYEAGPVNLEAGDLEITATVTAKDPDGTVITDTVNYLIDVRKDCIWIHKHATWSVWDKEAGASSIWEQERRSRNEIDEYQKLPNCIADKLGGHIDYHNLKGNNSTAGISQRDLNLINNRADGTQPAWALHNSLSSHAAQVYNFIDGLSEQIQETSELGQGGIAMFGWHGYQSGLSGAYTGYFNSNCEWVQKSDDYAVCGFLGTADTPVSLIFDEAKSSSENAVVVKFNLGNEPHNQYSLWRGSDAAPLLVYDPAKTGDVKNATQLFGNWTFGGKGSGPIAPVSMQKFEKAQPWRDGYEALGALDYNNDGKLSNNEIADIYLWFDGDRDAVVDEGEIRSLASENVTALFYRDPEQLAGQQDLAMTVGFEKTLTNRKTYGRSVDWFGEQFSSMKEASDALSALYAVENRYRADAQATENLFQPPKVAKQDYANDISGYWIWNLKEDKNFNKPGIFALEQNEDGTVKGYNIVESLLEGNTNGLRSAVKQLPVSGTVKQTADGLELTLVVPDQRSGSLAKSTVLIKENGRLMEGVTSQNFNNQQGRGTELEYEWVAGRVG